MAAGASGFFVLGQRVTLRGKVFRDPRYLVAQNVFWKKYFAMQGIFISTERGISRASPAFRRTKGLKAPRPSTSS